MKRIILLAFCFSFFQSYSQTANSGEYIAVIGEASGTFLPDMITFHFSINALEKKQLNAVDKLNNQASLFVEKITNLGIDPKEIKLSNYNLEESFDYSGDKVKNMGYEASESFELEIKYSDKDFNILIDSISGTKFPNLTFTYEMTFSDSLKNKVKNDLIKQACNNATEIAKSLAEIRNVKLGDIFAIEYTGNISALYGYTFLPPPPPPPALYNATRDAPKISSSRISMKGIEKEQQVRIVFKINNAR
jgi:uncharacterized protein YggE